MFIIIKSMVLTFTMVILRLFTRFFITQPQFWEFWPHLFFCPTSLTLKKVQSSVLYKTWDMSYYGLTQVRVCEEYTLSFCI